MNNAFSPEVKFCVRYLLNHGVNSLNFTDVVKELGPNGIQYDLVKSVYTNYTPFFEELAGKLRELWPPGEKDGKWPWRDSIGNLSRRLETLWKDRGFKKKTVEECLIVARKYLAQYEDNAKYMQTLKYFILKQDKIVDSKTGRIRYINKSVFADMLESNSVLEEWEDVFDSSNTIEQGELI